jgi:hypothetical protein
MTESILIEHVRFMDNGMSGCPNPTGPCVEIWFRNTGIITSKITSIKIINIDAQTLVLNPPSVNLEIPIKSVKSQKYTASDLLSFDSNAIYKVSVVTSSGNAFSKITKSYNT